MLPRYSCKMREPCEFHSTRLHCGAMHCPTGLRLSRGVRRPVSKHRAPLILVVPYLFRLHGLEQKARALVIGRVEPEHAVKRLQGLLKTPQPPLAQTKPVRASKKRPVVDVPQGNRPVKSAARDSSPMRTPTSN
jgi:hypothetical protein